MRTLLAVLSCAGFLAFIPPTPLRAAGPLAPQDVPEPLKPWIGWALHGQEQAKCPALNGSGGEHRCLWPSRLELSLDDKGGAFTQSWRVYGEAWVALPGDAKRWPQETTVDGTPAPVILRGGSPALRLSDGRHTVSGSFRWDALPEILQVPNDTGLLSLSVRGAAARFPMRDEQGRVWLQRTHGVQAGEKRMDIIVHRRLEDDVPLRLLTQVQLKVSGENREVVLGRALPEGFVPMALQSPLPARLDPDGRLRVQVRPGNWVVSLEGRHEGPAAAVTLSEPGGAWDSDEAWVFVPYDSFRLASVEGVPAIDPQQTELPEDWRQFAAYLMRPGSTMKLVERRRGDADPAADRLSLDRTFWLDFNGGGMTVQDRIAGTLRRSWRLEMAPGTQLGRAAVSGEDQFLNALSSGGPAGIEIRQGTLDVSADSRIPGRTAVPAVSWNHDFDRVKGSIHTPPGWRLVHAWGVDKAYPTWVARWTLLDFFLVLILAFSIGKLWGWRWGAAGLVAAGLVWHEPSAPRYVWLFALAGEALVRALPEGVFLRWVRAYRYAVWVVLLLVSIPFLILQVRNALYPQLERGSLRGGSGGITMMDMMQMGALAEEPASPAAEQTSDFDSGEGGRMAGGGGNFAGKAPMKRASRAKALRGSLSRLNSMESEAKQAAPQVSSRLYNLYAPDPKSQVSTGPGLPSWTWNEISLSWRGPVRGGQRLFLLWIPPWLNFMLSLLRVGLVIALALLFFNLPVEDWLKTLGSREGWRKAAGALLPLLLLAAGAFPTSAKSPAPSDTPTPEILQELKRRLLAEPECSPDCADMPKMSLRASGELLELRLRINADAQTAVPLPGGAKQWLPARVELDGAWAPLMLSPDGTLWVALSRGSHEVRMEGPIPERETLQLPLPLKPHRVESSVAGWILDGVHEDGQAEDNLQLTRRGGRSAAASAMEATNLPPFVRVERTLSLGLSWQVATTVERLTPVGSAVVLEIPLLDGESITSANVRTAKGKALVSMGPQTAQVQWSSVLEQAPVLELRAPGKSPWVEVWRLDASPIWNTQPEGIPAVHAPDDSGARVREWRPWPGESVKIRVQRPEGVPGQTITFDRAALRAAPGIRATDSTLELHMRSNRGGQHTLVLPPGAELQGVKIDGNAEPVRQEGLNVTFPVRPGTHIAEFSWREPKGIGMAYRTPKVDLGLGSVNANLSVSMPEDRWTLFVGGPRMGPAVLFWSLLVVFGLVSLGLGKIRLTPLGAREWFLLSLGLTQTPVPVAAVVALWFLALGWRKRNVLGHYESFDVLQAGLGLLTLVAFACLFSSIAQGLLGLPDMQIGGNGSSAHELLWYQDRAGAVLPRAWAFSVPLMVYRLAMLCWALWLASSLLGWIRWGWGCFTEGGYWKARLVAVPPPPAPKS